MQNSNPSSLVAETGLNKNATINISNYLILDVFGIYGTDIYVLYSDFCNRDVAKMMAVIKVTRLRLFNRSVLKDAAHRQDYSGRTMVPVDDLYNKIKELYPSFDV